MNAVQRQQVVIVGAGIIGASIAFHFASAGADVVVIDEKGPASGASGASDGAVSVASKLPGLSMYLALESKGYYETLSLPGGPLEGVYSGRSTNLVATDEFELAVMEEHAAELQKFGLAAQIFKGAGLKSKFPYFSDQVSAVFGFPDEGHALGYQVVDRFLQHPSIRILRNQPVLGLAIAPDGRRVGGVRVGGGQIDGDLVFVCAGLGSRQLLGGLGLYPRKGHLIVTDAGSGRQCPDQHLMFASYLVEKYSGKKSAAADKPKSGSALVIDPLRSGQLLIGSSREDDADETKTNLSIVCNILRRAAKFIPHLRDRNVIRVFAGIRAATPDQLPLVGPVPNVEGLWVATGLEGDGICLAPLVGREIANWASGRDVMKEIQELSPSRHGKEVFPL